MTESRDFGRMALELREALDTYSREELADLLTHIVRVYVIEGNEPISMDSQAAPGLGEMRGLSFAQVILRLQMSLPHEELRRLQVSGTRVWVEHQGREIALTDDGPDEVPPDREVIAPEMSRPAAVPLREPEPWESPGASVSEAEVETPAAADPAPVAAPGVERVSVEPEPWSGAPGVRRTTAPGAVTPRSSERVMPGVGFEEVGRVERPALDLRSQPSAEARRPGAPPRRSRPAWSAELTTDEVAVPDRSKDEDVGDVSERFSMLELD